MSIDVHRKYYYMNLFPYEDCYRWLSYQSGYMMPLREIAFGVNNNMFLRNLSFYNALDFKLNARRICPIRIDLGAVYNMSPALAVIDQTNKPFKFSATQKEVVFDIDISDYEEVRNCCKGSEICQKCWKYMALACKILDAALREDFGFEHILWNYSGGRGVHCWVCDEKARKLRTEEREAIADYLQVIKGGAFNIKKVYFEKSPHPSVKRALRIIEPLFVNNCVEEQQILGTEDGIEIFLKMISSICNSKTIKDDLKTLMEGFENSRKRWDAVVDFFQKTNEWRNCFVIEEIMIQYVYPRLDIAVTTVFNHLLKCPFSPHNRTNKICIPIDITKVDDFDPTTAPDFSTLFEEDRLEKVGKTNNLHNLEKFRESIIVFKKFIDKLEKKTA